MRVSAGLGNDEMHIERPTYNRRPDAESDWLFEIKGKFTR